MRRPFMRIPSVIPLALLLATGNARGGPEDVDPGCPTHPDKSGYHLFNPVPDELLRELDTDRPDKATSPHTVDAGHFQVESDFARFSRTWDAGARTDAWALGSTDLRVGLTNWADLQFFIPFYQSVRETDADTHQVQRHSGIGDLTVILKANFWGNDSDEGAGGAALFVKTPTAAHSLGNGKVEGGALLLWVTKAPLGFDFTFNSGAAVAANDEGGGYHAELINVLNFTHELAGPVSAYAEFFSTVPTQHSGDWVGTVDVGFLVKAGRDLQFDAGLNIGVTRGAEDLEPFVGVTYRF